MIYAGKPMDEIAGMDDIQMAYVYFRERDESGNLVRIGKRNHNGGVPLAQRASFEQAFLGVKRFQGMSEAQAKEDWKRFLKENPSVAAFYAQEKRRSERLAQMKEVRNKKAVDKPKPYRKSARSRSPKGNS